MMVVDYFWMVCGVSCCGCLLIGWMICCFGGMC